MPGYLCAALAPEGQPLDQFKQFLAEKQHMPGAKKDHIHRQCGEQEQAKGDGATIGPCTDVYLLGATLRALLNDGPLRVGTTVDELLGEAASGGWSELPKDAVSVIIWSGSLWGAILLKSLS